MKSGILIVIFSVLFLFSLPAEQKTSAEPLAAYKIDSLWHFIDYNGKELFPPVAVNNVFGFSEGMFCVSKMIDNKEKWGYIDLSGKFVIEPKYDKARLFSDGFAVVLDITEERRYPVKYYFIDKKGKILNNFILIDALDFSEGLAYANSPDKTQGYIDTTGKFVIDLKKSVGNKFSEGIASVSNEKFKSGFINKKGDLIISYQYESVGKFSEGLSAVFMDAKFGYIDKTDSFKILASFDYAHEFYEGRAFVGELFPQSMKTIWMIIDTSGNYVSNNKYLSVWDFSEGSAAVRDTVSWGFIDKESKYTIESQFSYAASFVNGIAWASKKNDGLYGYIDNQGEYILKIDKFEKIIDLRLNKRMY